MTSSALGALGAGPSLLSNISNQLNNQRNKENVTRVRQLVGDDVEQIQQDIDRFAGDRFKEAANALNNSGSSNLSLAVPGGH